MERMAHLMGLRGEDLRGSRLEAYTYAVFGDSARLTPEEGAGLADRDRREWARARVLERLDEEIAGLEAHFEALDLEAFDRDRAEAADRALFDPSKEATLARRYEAEARRGFFRALKEFREVEAEVEGARKRLRWHSAPREAAPIWRRWLRLGRWTSRARRPRLGPGRGPSGPRRRPSRPPEGRAAGP